MFILYLKGIKLPIGVQSHVCLFFLYTVEMNDWLLFSMRTSKNGILPFSSNSQVNVTSVGT